MIIRLTHDLMGLIFEPENDSEKSILKDIEEKLKSMFDIQLESTLTIFPKGTQYWKELQARQK